MVARDWVLAMRYRLCGDGELLRERVHICRVVCAALIIQGEFLHKVCMAGVAPQLKELVLQSTFFVLDESLSLSLSTPFVFSAFHYPPVASYGTGTLPHRPLL